MSHLGIYTGVGADVKVIATFGEAVLVKDGNGRIDIIGGGVEDRSAARQWQDSFLSPHKSAPLPGRRSGRTP